MAQTKRTDTKDTQAKAATQAPLQPEKSVQPQAESGTSAWFHEQILERLGPISGQALITASHAHGSRCDEWMAECLEVQGHPDLAEAYRKRLRAEEESDQQVPA